MADINCAHKPLLNRVFNMSNRSRWNRTTHSVTFLEVSFAASSAFGIRDDNFDVPSQTAQQKGHEAVLFNLFKMGYTFLKSP